MKETVRKIVEGARGDDLSRAKMAFQGWPVADMNKPYGQSSSTPNQIIKGYEEWNRKIDDCLKWIDER